MKDGSGVFLVLAAGEFRFRSAPFVFRITALQLRFELGIGFAPEERQIIGDLNRAVARREHLNPHWNTAVGNP
jgi:hypothetical protein